MSKGPSTGVIPQNLVGMTESGARDALRNVKLVGGATMTENSSTMPEGRVLRTEPAVGEAVPVNTEVNIILSTGKVTVPELTGLPRDQAEAKLLDPSVLLTPKMVEVESADVAPGTVISQSVAPGTAVEPRTSVVVTVAKEPAAPSPTPSPSPTGTGTMGRR